MITLTPRQIELTELASKGLDSQDIADAVGIKVNTVRITLQQARERVGAKNIAHLVAISIRKGLICMLVVTMLTGTDDGLRRSSKTRIVRRVEQVEMYA
ncbi:helix-turn-helix transcriptional regulator [Vreelandella populi]|uniref:helix-turn-helix transcriptional regulator n=1 Tax=Vreelandella populi TaxID=2498858 RepID=UPI000F8D0092|nr:helix-turn-helix transcriptional regulator [Halomonas populi]RUR38511.1 helix-turn-helix transcriptional regulator [Halomonas populi]